MIIGTIIKEERQKREWTQEQLGEKLNVSRSAVSSWEVGRNYPDLETIILISDLFEISLDKLLREDKEMTRNVTKKLKMNRFYKISLVTLIIIIVSYLGFNIHLSNVEKKYHRNLEKNGWKIYSPENKAGFNQFILDEDGIHYYTTIFSTGLIGFPLEEQKLKIIAKKDGLAVLVQDKNNMEIVISKENDSRIDFNSKVKINEKLEIIENGSSISVENKKLSKEYIRTHEEEYQDLISKTLKKIEELKK